MFLDYDTEKFLKYFSSMYNISAEDVLENIKKMNNRTILKQHPYKIFKGSDGRYKTYVKDDTKPKNRRMIVRLTLQALEQAIIEDYNHNTISNLTVKQLYEKWMIWRKEIGTDCKTMQENSNEWKRFIQNHSFSGIKVKDVNLKIINSLFLDITKGHAITYKRMINVKSLLNGMFKYAVVYLEIIPHSPMADIDFKQFRNRCKPEKCNKTNYTEAERKAILEYLQDSNDVYDLSIQLAFHLSLRIGELIALKQEDILDNMICIQRSCRRNQVMKNDLTFSGIQYTVEERLKGNQSEGFRAIPLTESALSIIKKAIALNPEGEFLFMRNGSTIIGDTFNERLKKTCNVLKIPYRSSHQIRFTVATMMLEGGIKINQISTFLGHSNTQTTFHYIRQRKADHETIGLMENIFG